MIGNAIDLGMSSRVPARPHTAAFDPASLFAGGAQGVLYDINPESCAVAVGASVASLSDASGNGNNATQGTPASRPILRQDAAGQFYLQFDGTDDGLQTAPINLSSSDAVTIVLGLRKLTNTPAALAVEFSANAFTTLGGFYLAAPEGTGSAADYRFYARGSVNPPSTLQTGAVLAPDTSVLTAFADISASLRSLRRNGAEIASSTANLGIGNIGNHALYLGSRAGASLRFNGWIYGLIVINRALTPIELAKAEGWMASKAGVALA